LSKRDELIEAMQRAIAAHVKCDATGLSPAVASVLLVGLDDAATYENLRMNVWLLASIRSARGGANLMRNRCMLPLGAIARLFRQRLRQLLSQKRRRLS
jgi:hypothetical protein